MHMCCANCSLYPIKHLSGKGMELRGLWFNPNIHPEEEYGKRLSALRELQSAWGLDIEYIDRYGLKEQARPATKGGAAPHDREERCAVCYGMRLERTAVTAKKMGLDGFTTTLLVSPYQKQDLIVRAGEEAARKHAVRFYFEDMRPGFREGLKVSKELGLYRQKYCGCIYSEAERRGLAPAAG